MAFVGMLTCTQTLSPPDHLPRSSMSPASRNARHVFRKSPCRSPMANKRSTAGTTVGTSVWEVVCRWQSNRQLAHVPCAWKLESKVWYSRSSGIGPCVWTWTQEQPCWCKKEGSKARSMQLRLPHLI